jgi:chromosome segregation ATPase
MRNLRIFAAFALLSAPLVFGGTVFAQQDQSQSGSGDPVADAARKAREAKKNAPKPKKVFTDDDVASKLSETAPASVASSAADSGSATPAVALAKQAKADAEQQKEDPNSEAAWRKRFAAQRRKIANAEAEIDVLQREASKADLQYYNDPQKAMNEQLTRDEINKKNDKIAAKKKEIEDLKQQLSDMEDQLRAAGGDPGWAR